MPELRWRERWCSSIFYRSDPDALAVSGTGGPSHRSAFRSPLVWSLAALSGLAGMGSLSANFFVPSAAQALFHLDQVGASYLISTGFTLAIFVNLLFGFLMDRFNRWKVMAALAGSGNAGRDRDDLARSAGLSHRNGSGSGAGTRRNSAILHARRRRAAWPRNRQRDGRGEHGGGRLLVPRAADAWFAAGLERRLRGGLVFHHRRRGCDVIAWCSRCGVIRRARVAQMATVVGVSAGAIARWPTAFPHAQPRWIEPGKGAVLPAELQFDDSSRAIGNRECLGPVDTKGHPFFEPLGANGRACVTCHQPAYAMTISVAAIRERWNATQGKDPLFAAVDGSNCPDLPQDKESSHSLLLNRGLIRLAIPWPPAKAKPEFSIEVVSDPTGCNTSATYGLHSATAGGFGVPASAHGGEFEVRHESDARSSR